VRSLRTAYAGCPFAAGGSRENLAENPDLETASVVSDTVKPSWRMTL
jgi:hypothetical protein